MFLVVKFKAWIDVAKDTISTALNRTGLFSRSSTLGPLLKRTHVFARLNYVIAYGRSQESETSDLNRQNENGTFWKTFSNLCVAERRLSFQQREQ